MSSKSNKVIRSVRKTFTVNTSAYASGDALHAGVIEFDKCFQYGSKTGRVVGACLTDLDNKNTDLTVCLFSGDLPNTTVTINAALDIHDTDLLKLLGTFKISSADYDGFADNTQATKELSIPVVSENSSLFVILKSRDTDTWTTTTALTLTLFIEQD